MCICVCLMVSACKSLPSLTKASDRWGVVGFVCVPACLRKFLQLIKAHFYFVMLVKAVGVVVCVHVCLCFPAY